MTLTLLVLGAALLVLPGAGVLRPDRLGPVPWARLCAASLSVGASLVQASLAMAAAPTVLRALGVHGAANLCHRMFGALGGGGAVTGWLSLAGFAWVTVIRLSSRKRDRRLVRVAAIESWLGDHVVRDGFERVTIPLVEAPAYTVPGQRPGRGHRGPRAPAHTRGAPGGGAP